MWACLCGYYNSKYFATTGVSQCVWSCVWCWWSAPLPQCSYHALPCHSAWINEHEKVGTFGLCAVLCKISNTGHLCCWYNTSICSFCSRCLSQLSKKAKYLRDRGARERPSSSCGYGSVLRLCPNTSQLDLDFCISPFFFKIILFI